jgi:3-deoxy-7-phosphoheptulonate synthase
MIVAMQESATEEQIQQVVEHLIEMGFSVHRSTGRAQTVFAAVGCPSRFRYSQPRSAYQESSTFTASARPYKLAGRSFRPAGTIVEFANGVKIGGEQKS